jgi:DNA gyrase inhibitor GyrI
MPFVADLSFHIVDLPCYCVATARGFGTSPEMDAWSTLLEWAERNGLDPVSGGHRFFGFNDPSPSSPDSPYGYQQWMTIPPNVGVDSHEDVALFKFSGGRYITTRCEGLPTITDRWRDLYEYADDAHLGHGEGPGLEELLTLSAAKPDEYVFDLYLPIAHDG